jgi:hypothetical protein
MQVIDVLRGQLPESVAIAALSPLDQVVPHGSGPPGLRRSGDRLLPL